jgi:Ca2+-binding EF-hand superfamily protein
MAVAVAKKTSGSGYDVGSITSGKERMEERDFLRIAFDSFDTDKSGFIDPHELRAALTMLGVRRPGAGDTLARMSIDDVDGDGTISLADLDTNNDEKIDFEEFKVLAALLPKRDHPIYRNTLRSDPIKLPKDARKTLTPVQRDQYAAQQELNEALRGALARLREKLRLTSDAQIMKDNNLRRSFDKLDESGDGRVDSKELIKMLQDGTDVELTKRDAWVLMNCADTNNDKHMTFDEFKRMMQTVAIAAPSN